MIIKGLFSSVHLKIYVVGTEAILMNTHNTFLNGEIWKIIS